MRPADRGSLSETGRYYVRALDRSLTILRIVNQHNGLLAAELARLVNLPPPTVLRLLNTLSAAGYVARSGSDGRFRATLRLRELSSGYEEESWLRNVVQPFLAELEQEVVWPLAVICLYDKALIVEALTDADSRMVLRRDSAGIAVPLLTSSSGYLYMALLPPPDGDELLNYAIANGAETLERLQMTTTDVKALSRAAAENEYSELHLPSHSALAVPVHADGRLFCALSMRMYGSIHARRSMVADYLADLQSGAEDLGRRIAKMGSLARSPARERSAYS